MPVPTFHVNISGSIVAAYGAVVATITGAVQIINFLRDRRNIKITARHNMQIIGDPRYERKNLTVVRVANAGRRPVTITAIGAYRLHPHNAFVLADTGIAATTGIELRRNARYHASRSKLAEPHLGHCRPIACWTRSKPPSKLLRVLVWGE